MWYMHRCGVRYISLSTIESVGVWSSPTYVFNKQFMSGL